MTRKTFAPRVGYLVNRAARLMNRWADAELQPLGLAAAQMPVLGALQGGARMTQKELAQVARIEQPTMAQLLNRMERDGLVKRSANPEDGRSSLLSLTRAAHANLPAGRKVLEEGMAEMLRGFSEAEVGTLMELLERMVGNGESLMVGKEEGRG